MHSSKQSGLGEIFERDPPFMKEGAYFTLERFIKDAEAIKTVKTIVRG
jgi:hypothetical protein